MALHVEESIDAAKSRESKERRDIDREDIVEQNIDSTVRWEEEEYEGC